MKATRRCGLAAGSLVAVVLAVGACGGSDGVGADLTEADAGADVASPGDDASSPSDAGGGDGSDGAPICAVPLCNGACDPGNYPGNVEVCGDNKDNDCDGVPDNGCGGIGTFVSTATGNDATGTGTTQNPVKTIAKGIANARTIGAPRTVFVAAGHYAENVDLSEGVSLSGGYDCAALPCTWNRDPMANKTYIDAQRQAGLLANNTVTKITVIDGFQITGQATGGAAAVTLTGGTPTITNNVITVAARSGGINNAVGIAVGGGPNDPTGVGAVIKSNRITAGDAPGATSAGIVLQGFTVFAQISNNTIRSGLASSSRGIRLGISATSTLVQGNDILVGSADPSTNNSTAWAIEIFGYGTFDSNKINVDQANVGTCASSDVVNFTCGGGILDNGLTAVITNNVVYGVKGNVTAALFLMDNESAPGVLHVNGNYLNGAGAPGVASSRSEAVGMRIGGGQNALFGRIRNNILVGGVNAARFGVYEHEPATRTNHPMALDHNDFFIPSPTASDHLYHFWNGSAATNLDTATAIQSTVPNAGPNLNADPLVDATWHVAKTSPCVGAGTMTEAPPKDFEGDARPQGGSFDIGPDESK